MINEGHVKFSQERPELCYLAALDHQVTSTYWDAAATSTKHHNTEAPDSVEKFEDFCSLCWVHTDSEIMHALLEFLYIV